MKVMDEGLREKTVTQRLSARLVFTVFSCTLGASFQFGFSTGFVNNVEPYMKRYLMDVGVVEEGADARFMSLWSIAVGGFAIGGVVSTFVFPKVAQMIGRKAAILSTTIFCFVSSYLIAFPTSQADLIIGRIMVGMSAGGACAVVPTYVTEIAPLELRGTLGTVHQLLITIGIFVAQLVSTAEFGLFGSSEKWQCCLLIPCACALIMLSTLPFCEDSPSYLFHKFGEERARNALSWFRPNGQSKNYHIDEDIEKIKEEQALSQKDAFLNDIFHDPLLWRPLVVATIVNLSMQFSGIDAIFYYSTYVFHRAGVSERHAQVYTTIISFANVVITIPAMLLMDVAGRKMIQTVGLSGMCTSFVVMTIALVAELHILSLVAMMASISCFAMGPGCIAWFITSELMPLHARPVATTVALTVNWSANLFIAGVFPRIEHMLGNYAFATFAASTACLALFTVVHLPETKGKTITEVREWFLRHSLQDYSKIDSAQVSSCN